MRMTGALTQNSNAEEWGKAHGRARKRERSRRSVKMDEIGRYQQNMFRTKRTAVMFQVKLMLCLCQKKEIIDGNRCVCKCVRLRETHKFLVR